MHYSMPSKPAESNSILNLILLNSNLMIFTELGLELKIFRNDNLNSNLNLKLRKLVNSNCTRLRCKQVNTNSNCTYWKKSSSPPAYLSHDFVFYFIIYLCFCVFWFSISVALFTPMSVQCRKGPWF